MTKMTPQRLAEIQERDRLASRGPWSVEGSSISAENGEDGIAGHMTPNDAYFIAHARDDVPDLLAEVQRLSESLAEAEQKLAAGNRKSLADYSWEKTTDRSARTAPGRAAFKQKFYDAVDPDRVLEPLERERRAEAARTEYYRNIGVKSAAARRAKRELEGKQ